MKKENGSNEYPYGDNVTEPYDIERDKKLINKNTFICLNGKMSKK